MTSSVATAGPPCSTGLGPGTALVRVVVAAHRARKKAAEPVFPAVMPGSDRWVRWTLQQRPSGPTKVPLPADNGRNASVRDP